MKKLFGFLPIIIFIAAFVIRVWGIIPGYPDNHPDEGTSYQSAVYMLYHFLLPPRFDYPAGMPLIHLGFYVIFILPFVMLKLFVTHPSNIIAVLRMRADYFQQYQELVFGPANINALYWSRFLSTLIGTGAVIFVYLAGKKIFNKRVGIIAALFLAFNFRHVLGSHFGLPDVLNSLINIVSLYVSYRLLENPNKKNYILCGIVAGIGFSLKYQPFVYLPFFAAQALLAIQKKKILYLVNWQFIKSFLISLVTFFLINPYYPLNIGEAIRQNTEDYLRYQMGHFAIRPYPYFYLFHWGVGELILISVALGAIGMLMRDFKKSLLVLSFAFTFMFVMTIYSNGGIYPRNFINVMPYLMLFAGYFADFVYQFLKKIHIPFPQIIISSLVLIAVFPSIKNAVILDQNYSKPWGTTTASNWLEKNLPSNTKVRYYNFLYQTFLSLKSRNIEAQPWEYNFGPNSLAEFQDEGTNFAVLNTQPFQAITYWWRSWSDPKRMFGYNTVPFDYVEESYFGLATRELLQNTVFETYKPWQAQDEYNYIVFKIPKKPTDVGSKIQSFNFDTKDSAWRSVDPFNFDPLIGGWTGSVGNNKDGSIVITGGGDTTERFVSPVIRVIPGKMYTVKAYIKAPSAAPLIMNKLTKESVLDADGFIRLDMYNKGDNMSKHGEMVALSSRAWKDGQWHQEQVSLVAPKGVAYMTISLQRKSFIDGSVFFDDIEVFEGGKPADEQFNTIPYIKSTIPLESLYYNSFI